MHFPSLSHTLDRVQWLRRRIDGERQSATASEVRLLRLQNMLLKGQERLAMLLDRSARRAQSPVATRIMDRRMSGLPT